MRVGIDAQDLNGKPQGTRTYLLQLLRRLSRIAEAETEELIVYSFEPERSRQLLGELALTHRRLYPRTPRLRLPVVLPFLEWRHGLDVFHSQYICPPLSPIPEVVTIHDILFETHPELFEGAFSAASVWLIRRSARRARLVLTVSEFSRRELVERYRLPEEKVLVTPDAVDHDRFRPREAYEREQDDVRARYRLGGPYLLSVGRIDPRKNLARTIRAFLRLKESADTGVTLALVGASDFGSPALEKELQGVSEDAVRLLGPVPDEDLPALYAAAEGLVYPSLVEGFGMPVLEAMACGIPVLTSSRGALPEVGGEAVLYVEPEDEEALQQGMERLLGDRELRERLTKAGPERAARFRWESTAEATLEAYRRAAAG